MKTASERSSSVASDWTSRTARKRRIDRSGSEPREQRAPDAFREEEDEGHEDRPDHERPGLGEDRETVLEDEERRGADEGAEEGAGAAEQRHDDDLPGGRPVERFDRDDVEPEGVEGAGEPREERGEDERQELDAARVVAARGGALAVLADRLEHGAEGRVEDALEGGDRRDDERQGKVVEGERRVERDRGAGEDLRGERLVRDQEREDREDDEERDDGVGRDPASHCSGVREAGAVGGWLATRCDPAAFPKSRFIPATRLRSACRFSLHQAGFTEE